MYPFASVDWAWDELWAAVHERVPWTPKALTRSGDVHARWDDPDCIITQICGWPFVADHREDMQLIGTCSLDLPEAAPNGRYHSVLLSPHDRPLDELVDPCCHAAVNSDDSLSGWHSLRAATTGAGRRWPGTVTFTAAHRESVRVLARGDADIASIDSWTLAFIADETPELLAGLHRVGLGPTIPTPALTARTSLGDAAARELRLAFDDALSDGATAAARTALHITGFTQLDLDDYLAIGPLGRAG
jgi:ABC-type phosphate/phosphonate transport system substrate-binding protein